MLVGGVYSRDAGEELVWGTLIGCTLIGWTLIRWILARSWYGDTCKELVRTAWIRGYRAGAGLGDVGSGDDGLVDLVQGDTGE